MRTGFENKRNVAIMAVLLAVMIILAVRFVNDVFIGSAPPTPTATVASAPTPATTPPGALRRTLAAGTAGPAARRLPSLVNLDPTLHPELMAGAESLKYTGDGRNIFSMSSAPEQKIERVKGPVRPDHTEIAKGPQGPPPPPPIDLTFFGYAAANGSKQAFLLHGQDVYIAREGDVVDHHYKIVRINPLSIEVTDLLYNNTQTLPLVQG